MQKIKNWFEDDAANSGEHYDFLEYEGHLEVRTETAIFMVVEPHSGTNRKWMLRISTIQHLLSCFLIQMLNCAIIYMIISLTFTKDC
mgnify:CR=1 FL=1